MTNQSFWNRKLDGNMARDASNRVTLEALGWTVFIIWECRLNEDTEILLAHLRRQLFHARTLCFATATQENHTMLT